ncbi:hypothetical protein DEFDS_P250 (plasmid) [Deferribacter desulfuricans SSM1]|uniref:Radical SAM core domain-containing protein n=1 Tax=Deferribacter desulfuricans (strain DSM 14783 / JCM 11476 / NBRC 101012 / SSM1) TaxID=639282 RepID=D3PF78_DEFDS|nr:radical SAM protein [Deferribacter desulfuricans]BAI81870.1 hypothetical protein DEFDS_P250 [Deferribacter desulfuricans SSM1]
MRINLLTTTKCNFKCKYCFARADTHNKYFDQADKWNIDLKKLTRFFQDILDFQHHVIRLQYYGGEPILRLDKMIEIAKHIHNKINKTSYSYHSKPNVFFGVITNGTYLTAENIESLVYYGIKFNISFDFVEEISKYNRDESVSIKHLKEIVKNYKKAIHKHYPFLDKYPEFYQKKLMSLTIQTVTTKKHIKLGASTLLDRYRELLKKIDNENPDPKYKGLIHFNVKILDTEPIIKDYYQGKISFKEYKEFLDNILVTPDEFENYYRDCLTYLKENDIPLYIENNFVNFLLCLFGKSSIVDNNILCSLGQNYLSILPNGDIWLCPTFAQYRSFNTDNAISKVAYVGNINDGLLYSKLFLSGELHERLNYINHNTSTCHMFCDVGDVCQSCPADYILKNNTMNSPVGSYRCSIFSKIYKVCNEFYNQLDEKTKKEYHEQALLYLFGSNEAYMPVSKYLIDISTKK